MGCSSEKVTFEPYNGQGLRKETYYGKPTSSVATTNSAIKYFVKYLEWRKLEHKFIDKDDIKNERG